MASALSEFIDTEGFSAFRHGESPTAHIVVASLFAAIIGSISFWGSLIAFGKLQEILPGRPIGLGKAQQALNLLLLAGAVASASSPGFDIATRTPSFRSRRMSDGPRRSTIAAP